MCKVSQCTWAVGRSNLSPFVQACNFWLPCFTAARSGNNAARVRSCTCADTGASDCEASCKRAACARFKKAAYTLEFLPAAGPAAPAAARVRDAEAKLLQKRGGLQSFEAEFQQARATPDRLSTGLICKSFVAELGQLRSVAHLRSSLVHGGVL